MSAYYRILKFSPVPEFIDPVNIALIVSNGNNRIYYDKSFRRLRCVVPSFDVNSLEFLLNKLEVELNYVPSASLDEAVVASSAQFYLSEARQLERNVEGNEIEVLVSTYLMPLSKHREVAEKPEEQYVDSRLHDFLSREIQVPESRLLKRARPVDFLSRRSVEMLGQDGLSIRRVLSGTKGIILIDAINLGVRNKTYLARQAEQTAYTFFRIGKVAKQIEEVESRFLKRVSVAFGMEIISIDPHLEYHAAKLERESEIFVNPNITEKVKELAEVCAQAKASLI